MPRLDAPAGAEVQRQAALRRAQPAGNQAGVVSRRQPEALAGEHLVRHDLLMVEDGLRRAAPEGSHLIARLAPQHRAARLLQGRWYTPSRLGLDGGCRMAAQKVAIARNGPPTCHDNAFQPAGAAAS